MIERPRVQIGLMIASLILSILLWAVVYPQHLPAESSRSLVAKVTYVGLPENLIVTEEPTTMTVFATGPGERLRAIDESRLEFVVNLQGATVGRRRYLATVTPPAYQEFFPTEESATFTIEELTSRKLTIVVEPQGQLQDDALAIDTWVTEPTTAIASGPKSAIDKLSVARARFDLGRFDPSIETGTLLAIEPVLTDGSISDVVTLDPKVVKVSPVISAAPISKPVNILAQASITVAEGYVTAGIETSPSAVTIRGPSRIVNSINQLATEPINAEGLTATKEFQVGLKVPKGVIVTGGVTTVKVRVLVNRLPENSPASP